MDDVKQQLADKLQTANNILVTVSRDPSVDQLAACLGLALFLNKQGKHTAAVFSGQVPSILEFLQPEETLEKTTDSLRDFIIALDKSKADKLRYKVEDNVVRIFITPYRTSIGQDDLEFSQGDFNVDLVVAVGVNRQEDLDEAITAHGRILHDATMASINLSPEGDLGSLNWRDPQSSSLCELVTDLAQTIDPSLIDGQIATALLTGIVAETDRFRNDRTSSKTMTASAALMAAGANQQLVASKLEEPAPDLPPSDSSIDSSQAADAADETAAPAVGNDGVIEIDHEHDEPPPAAAEDAPIELPPPDDGATAPASPDILPVEPAFEPGPETASDSSPDGNVTAGPKFMTGPPVLGGTLTANSQPPALDPTTDPLSLPTAEPPQLLDRKPEAPAAFTPPPADWSAPATPPADQPRTDDKPDEERQTLSEIESDVKSSEQQASQEAGGLETARDEVNRALNTAESTPPPKPIEALNAQPLVDSLHKQTTPQPASPDQLGPTLADILSESSNPASAAPAASQTANPSVSQPAAEPPQQNPPITDPAAPPPVPPPIPFQFGNQNPPQQ